MTQEYTIDFGEEIWGEDGNLAAYIEDNVLRFNIEDREERIAIYDTLMDNDFAETVTMQLNDVWNMFVVGDDK